MNKQEFNIIRKHLDKTQNQLAQLLGISVKAVQSFEQGWRNIPCHAERQLLFLLKKSNKIGSFEQSCWSRIKCPHEKRAKCPAWEYQVGNLCWFINGTICSGVQQGSWKKKMIHCRQCDVFKSHFPLL